MVLNRSTYYGKKVFVTGHTGFKGSWLLKILSYLGANVTGYALANEQENSLYDLIGGNDLCDSIICDINNLARLKEAIVSFEPDFIIHLAAQPLVRFSYEYPCDTFTTNVIGTTHVLEAMRGLKNSCVAIIITTDKVYHNNEWHFSYREDDRLGGYDPYSASKACTELVIDSYRNSFFNVNLFAKHKKSVGVCRAGNVIGGGDWSVDRLMPDIAKALGKGDEVIVRNPLAVRPWQHVMEPLFGYLLLGEKLSENPLRYSQAFNFGPNSEDVLSVVNMVELAIKSWGGGSFKISEHSNNLHEAGLLKLEISKAKAELDWVPKLNAVDSIELTIDWYKTYFQNPVQAICLMDEQIGGYLIDKVLTS